MSTENDLVAKCPECNSTFRLTQQHLEAAKGWVQCGMCGHVFHSGIKLAAAPDMEGASPSAQETIREGADETVTAEENTEFPTEAQATTGTSEPDTETAAQVGPEATPGLSGLSHRIAEQGVPSNFGPKLESIILVDPNDAEADDEYGPMPQIPPKQDTGKAGEAAPPAPSFTPAPPPPSGWGSRLERSATSSGWITPPPMPSAVVENEKSKLRWLWVLIVLALLAALAAQLVFHMRDKLAANYPELRPSLARMCDALGCSLSLPRDTRQVLILGSDLQTENENNMALEITLANRAPHAMAWPVLELTLTDVEDQPIARRMFAPSEYLPSSKMEAAGIQARTEIPFNLQLQSKGLKAAGYRLRMFY